MRLKRGHWHTTIMAIGVRKELGKAKGALKIRTLIENGEKSWKFSAKLGRAKGKVDRDEVKRQDMATAALCQRL